MRPDILNPLFTPITSLTGIGPKLSLVLSKLLIGGDGTQIANISDVLFHLPTGIIDRRNQPKIMDALEGSLATLEVCVDRHDQPPKHNKRIPYKAVSYTHLTLPTTPYV